MFLSDGIAILLNKQLLFFRRTLKASRSSCWRLSRTPKNLYCFPSSKLGILTDPWGRSLATSCTCTPLFTWTTEHFLGFHWRPTFSMADLVVSITRFNLVYEAAKSLILSIYKRFVTFASMGLESLYPSAAFIFQAIGFKQTVNCLGHKVSPCCKPLLNLIGSEVFPSLPCGHHYPCIPTPT